MIVSSAPSGARRRAGCTTTAEISMILSGVTTSSSTAVTVTIPALSVAPALTTSRRFWLRTKFPAPAGATAVASSCRVTSSVKGSLSVAVT